MMDLTMLIMSISDNTAAKLLQKYTTDEEINAWGEFGTALLAQLSRDIYDIFIAHYSK